MKFVLAAALSFIGCGVAHASVYSYFYETQPMMCRDCTAGMSRGQYRSPVPSASTKTSCRGAVWQVSTLEFHQELDESSSSHRWAFRRYEIKAPRGISPKAGSTRNVTSWNGAPFMELNYSLTGGGSNFFTEILGWTVYRGFMILSFDEDRNVVAWRGDNYNSDVGLDPRISNGRGMAGWDIPTAIPGPGRGRSGRRPSRCRRAARCWRGGCDAARDGAAAGLTLGRGVA